jgi:hypothetical protein
MPSEDELLSLRKEIESLKGSNTALASAINLLFLLVSKSSGLTRDMLEKQIASVKNHARTGSFEEMNTQERALIASIPYLEALYRDAIDSLPE